ncbi:MAG: amino acid adenylation domain-containing protein, partial [Aquabacterium sp.]|uniref:non-ribosomal peptide synthetase n=1 Tax=Aquabacterium sp. TaxID=1872578 RepID=UPI00271F115B
MTPSDLPLAKLSQAQLDALPVAHHQIEDLYPLSPMQQGILFHALQHGDDDPYFYQRVFSLSGALNTGRFIAAWQTAIDRHPALRSVYCFEDSHAPLQIVCKTRHIDLFEADLRGMPRLQRWDMLAQCLRNERSNGFDFAGQRGFVLSLLRVQDDVWWLIWSHHHIALDGWSMGLVLRDVMRSYYGEALPVVPAYGDYLHWLNSRDHGAALDFWRKTLLDLKEITPLPLAANAPDNDASRYEEIEISLSASETDALQAAARRYGVTVSTLLQAAYALLLGRHGGGDAVLFGVTVSGRSADLAEIDAMAGLFINTLPLRIGLAGRQALGDWLQAIQKQTAAMREYEFTPLSEIQRMAALGEGQNLFDAILVFENYPLDEVLKQQRQGLQIGLLEAEDGNGLLRHQRGRNNYALSLIAGLNQHLHLTFSGRQARFQPGAMALLARRFVYLLQQIVAASAAKLADLRLEPEATILPARSARPAPILNLLAAWQAQVKQKPSALAVCDQHRQLSFMELDLAADRLANCLLAQGVRREAAVGVLLELSTSLVVSLLAILKIGAVYLPLDTRLPAQRLGTLLKDSDAGCVVTANFAAKQLSSYEGFVLNLDELNEEPLSSGLTACELHPQQAAYRIYTSGSTGQPKGVTVSHAALNHYLQGVLPRLALSGDAVMAMISTPAADLGHTVLFGALCSGHALHLVASDCSADPDCFAGYMSANRIDALKIVPSHLRGLLQASHPADVLPEQVLILGGEACPLDLLETVRKLKPQCRIINHYGPTETTVGVLTHEPGIVQAGATVPIGQPLPGVEAYVLDGDLNPVPAGVPGELYIGGACLARGYQGKPGMTAERFLPNPYRSSERWYRTGDRAVYRDDHWVWLGRLDNQVKIRGYRIEPDEIARTLRELDGVADALVVAEPGDGRLQLLAYTVAERGITLEVSDLHTALVQRLPDYMMPAHILALDVMPLTANGKIDRKALPKPQQAKRKILAPRNELETQLAVIWQTVLKTGDIGVTDNFFELGGDSILSLQIIARARKQGIKLTPKLLFEKQTIAELVVAIGPSTDKSEQNAISRCGLRGQMPLSYGQERLWFLAQLQPDSTAYHISGGLRLSGRLDLAALKNSFDTLTVRHDMLRSRFIAVDGKPQQVAEDRVSAPLSFIDLTASANAAAELAVWSAQQAATPFDFNQGVLWRAALVAIDGQHHELWLTLHHLLADGWSVGRLLDEFAELYAAAVEQREARLPILIINYTDYAVWQRQWLAAGEGERQAKYWQQQLGGEQPVIELPTDHPRPPLAGGRAATQSFSLSAVRSECLKRLAVETSTTPFMVLLAAFAALLHRYSSQTDLRIGIPVANRNRVETEVVVGFFVNTLVLRADCRGELNFLQLLAQVKQTVLAAQEHADLPFEHLVDVLQPQRSLNRNPLFQVMVNHQKRDLSALKTLPGLAIERIGRDAEAAQFDLSLVSEEDENSLITGNWVYTAELFEPETIDRLSRHFLSLLEQWLAQPEKPLAAIALLGDGEQQQLADWNSTAKAYPSGLIHELISQRAAAQPDETALAFGGQTLSYGGLERQANRLAHYLISLGVGLEIPVGIAVERSFELVIGLLAIVKAGGAYVPLDPDYPADRLAYMIADSGIGLLLSHTPVLQSHGGFGNACRCLNLDVLDMGGQADAAPSPKLHPESPAYIIYTSGSTGRPKGAANSHAALANRLHWMQDAYPIGPEDTILQKTPFSFDVSVWEFFWPLMTGARLAIAEPGAHRDPAALTQLMQEHRVSTLHFVPAMLAEFVNQPELPRFPSLKRLVCSGEALPGELQQRVFQRLPGVELDNLYGPTEAAID